MNPYGFDWGPMKVERLAHISGRGYVLRISTEHTQMQVHITEKGRKIAPFPARGLPKAQHGQEDTNAPSVPPEAQ
jgi:hypothetical protein